MTARTGDLVIGRWSARFRGRRFACATGYGGIGDKLAEGDGITPKGRWRIVMAHYRADRLDRPELVFPVRAISPADIWSDDPLDPAYNHALRARRHPYSHERLYRADPLYDLVAVLDFNWPNAVPGAGSAIFLHRWRKPRHPTAGCIAFAPRDLWHILSRWQPDARVVIG